MITEEQAREELEKRAKNVKEDDLKRVLDKKKEIEEKFSSNGPLGKFVADAKILFSMIGDYWDGSYREVPWTTIAAAVGALLYVFSPVDLIPDVIPVLGVVDDALVIGLCLKAIDADLQVYLAWKKANVMATA